jgi:hypothetical protein
MDRLRQLEDLVRRKIASSETIIVSSRLSTDRLYLDVYEPRPHRSAAGCLTKSKSKQDGRARGASST